MKITVLGAGAIGGLFGAYLAQYHDVTLICREIHAAAINRNGLRITGLSNIHVHPGAFASPEGLKQPDILILTVKAYDTEQAINGAKTLVGSGTRILSLQNGLGNLETMARILPEADIIGGVTSQGAILREPGVIEHTGESYTMIGDEELANLFTEAGIDTIVPPDMNAEIWYKAMVNAVINPIGTLLKDKNGLLIRDGRLQPLARQIVSEGVDIAESGGIHLDMETAWQKVMKVAAETSENICSMRLDVERGRRTEIDQMNGAIARYAGKAGIAAPANAFMTVLVKALRNS